MIKPLEYGVINLDNSTGIGTHFTCYINIPNHKYVYYFDSFGALPPKQIEKYLKTSGKQIVYNTSQYQPLESKLCGYYCAFVINEMSRGMSFYDTINKFDMNDSERNDSMVKKYVKEL